MVFTNITQALLTSSGMLSRGGRESAQSAVLVITDGKYSFEHQMAEKAPRFNNENIIISMAPDSGFQGEELAIPKQGASQPWKT